MELQHPPDKAKAQAAREKGNDAFRKQQWAEAVGLYSAAHIADPTDPTYPLNRAMAYIKLGKFVDAECDCSIALYLSPNNVKALYRRATARVGADKLEDAVKDYEQVLRLDPSNAEAKTGLAKAHEALKVATPRRAEPMDLRKLLPSHGSNTAHDTTTQPTEAEARDSSSSVEAARKFLQHVGMSNDKEDKRSLPISKPSTSAPPAKFPGETGRFLREVTTRKTTAKPTSQQVDSSSSTVPSTSLATTQGSTKAEMEAQPTSWSSSFSSAANKTASALNFGGSTSLSSDVTPVLQARPPARVPQGKLTAIEFNRRWKSKPDRLQLLSSIDADTIPGMIDAMLEPELVAEILHTLVEGHRASPNDVQLISLVANTLTALPRCKRFGMTVCMLDSNEKSDAVYLIDAVGRPDLRSVWEVA
ncbi:hypothetical protein NDA13_002956 [Ustilago tritici]|nr:hypothetical protein NDA13_002956 [Ustilago tritici]